MLSPTEDEMHHGGVFTAPPLDSRSSPRDSVRGVTGGGRGAAPAGGGGPVITRVGPATTQLCCSKASRAAPRGGGRVPFCQPQPPPPPPPVLPLHHVALLLFTSWTSTSLPPSTPRTHFTRPHCTQTSLFLLSKNLHSIT